MLDLTVSSSFRFVSSASSCPVSKPIRGFITECITVSAMSVAAMAGSIIICITPGSEVPQVGRWESARWKFMGILAASARSSLVSQDWPSTGERRRAGTRRRGAILAQGPETRLCSSLVVGRHTARPEGSSPIQ